MISITKTAFIATTEKEQFLSYYNKADNKKIYLASYSLAKEDLEIGECVNPFTYISSSIVAYRNSDNKAPLEVVMYLISNIIEDAKKDEEILVSLKIYLEDKALVEKLKKIETEFACKTGLLLTSQTFPTHYDLNKNRFSRNCKNISKTLDFPTVFTCKTVEFLL